MIFCDVNFLFISTIGGFPNLKCVVFVLWFHFDFPIYPFLCLETATTITSFIYLTLKWWNCFWKDRTIRIASAIFNRNECKLYIPKVVQKWHQFSCKNLIVMFCSHGILWPLVLGRDCVCIYSRRCEWIWRGKLRFVSRDCHEEKIFIFKRTDSRVVSNSRSVVGKAIIAWCLISFVLSVANICIYILSMSFIFIHFKAFSYSPLT